MTVLEPFPTPRSHGMHASSSSARAAAPLALLGAGVLALLTALAGPAARAPDIPFAARPASPPAALAAVYVPNAGQAPAGVVFEARGRGGGPRFGAGEVVARGVRMRFAG